MSADLARRFASVYTGALTDVLDRHGHLQQTLPSALAPLQPGMRLAGPAYPILGQPHPGHDYDTSIRKILTMLGSVRDRSVTPQDCVTRWELLAHGDVTIVVGGVRVAPGDWVVGDRDGVVIVPAGIAQDVLSEAEEKVSTENAIRDSVRQGMLPLDAYERFGTF